MTALTTDPGARPWAVDSHAHILDTARFPLSNPVGYAPQANECGTAHEFETVLAMHGMTHALLVNPFAGYATDNSCMLDAIAGAGGRFKGIALVGHDTDERTFQKLRDGGVIGARFNTLFSGSTSLEGAAGQRLLANVREQGWFAQVYFHDDGFLQLLPILQAARIRVVVDHCGCPDPSRGLGQPGFQALLELGRRGQAAIKLSGAFRYSRQSWPYADADPFVQALIDAFTLENCVWGSDWPFVRVPHRMDYGPVRALLDRWLPDPAARRQVLWDTPARWFGFAEPQGAASGEVAHA
ncbi:MAG: amidohydrolase family protein [Polaromonas sp.]|nr:amidohydrolase family protein [Polaromonas sp.]